MSDLDLYEQERTPQVWEEQEDCRAYGNGRGLGTAGSPSQGVRHDPIRLSGGSSDGRISGKRVEEQSSNGGILCQLRALREAHLAYVDAHRERLEKRLSENLSHRQQLLKDLDILEQEIIAAIEKQNNPEAE